MPSRHSPEYVTEVDWNDTGTFDHPESNVSESVLKGVALYGSNAQNEMRVQVRTADGKITISNSDYRFDPDSPNRKVSEQLLRGKHRCRVTMDGVLLWEGLVSPDKRSRPSGSEIIVWDIESFHETSLQSSDNELLIPDNGTVARAAQIFTQQTGIQLNVASQQPTGIIHHVKKWLTFLDDFSRFSGGWVLETHTGDFTFRRFSDVNGLPVVARLGLNFEPLDTSSYISRPNHVRNSAKCRSFSWEPVTDDDDNPSEVLLTSRSFQTTGGVRTVTLEFTRISRQRIVSWDRFAIKQGDDVATITSFNVDGLTATVIVNAATSAEPVDVTVQAFGKADERRETAGIDFDITEGGTIETYGRRPLEVPPWFPNSFDGITSFTRPWLRNLSQPPGHVSAVYRSRQRSASQSNILANIRVGDAVDLVQIVDGTEVTIEAMILQIRFEWGQNIDGLHTFTGVRRRFIPENPLTLEIDPIADQSAQGIVGVPSPANEPIYFRFEQLTSNRLVWGSGNPILWGAGNPLTIGGIVGAWRELPSQRASTEELAFQMTTLDPNTDYLTEASYNADYSDPVTARFTTALEDLRNKLGEVRVNGNAIVGWNTSRDLEFDTSITFAEVSFTHTVAVEADPVDPAGTVTIDQATQSGEDQQVLTFTITVTYPSLAPRIYTLRVTVNAPFTYGFTDLPANKYYSEIVVDGGLMYCATEYYAPPDLTNVRIATDPGFHASEFRVDVFAKAGIDVYDITTKQLLRTIDLGVDGGLLFSATAIVAGPTTTPPPSLASDAAKNRQVASATENLRLGNFTPTRNEFCGGWVDGDTITFARTLTDSSADLLETYAVNTNTMAVTKRTITRRPSVGATNLFKVSVDPTDRGSFYDLAFRTRYSYARRFQAAGQSSGSSILQRVTLAEGGFTAAEPLSNNTITLCIGGVFYELAAPVPNPIVITRSTVQPVPANNDIVSITADIARDRFFTLDAEDNRIYAYRISTGEQLP